MDHDTAKFYFLEVNTRLQVCTLVENFHIIKELTLIHFHRDSGHNVVDGHGLVLRHWKIPARHHATEIVWFFPKHMTKDLHISMPTVRMLCYIYVV